MVFQIARRYCLRKHLDFLLALRIEVCLEHESSRIYCSSIPVVVVPAWHAMCRQRANFKDTAPQPVWVASFRLPRPEQVSVRQASPHPSSVPPSIDQLLPSLPSSHLVTRVAIKDSLGSSTSRSTCRILDGRGKRRGADSGAWTRKYHDHAASSHVTCAKRGSLAALTARPCHINIRPRR